MVEGVCRSRDSRSHPLGAAILTDDLSMLPRTPAIIASDTGAKRSSENLTFENFTFNSVHARKAKSLDGLIIDPLESAVWNATCSEMDQGRPSGKQRPVIRLLAESRQFPAEPTSSAVAVDNRLRE